MGLFGSSKQVMLKIDEVPNWLDRYVEEKDKDSAVKLFHQEFANKKGLLFRKLDSLEDKFPSSTYSRKVRGFFVNQSLPLTIVLLEGVVEQYAQSIEVLLEEVQSEFFVLRQKSAQDVVPAHQKLLEIEKLVVELVAFFERIGLREYRVARSAYDALMSAQERVEQLHLRIRDHERLKDEPLERLEKIRVRKEKLMGTKSFEVYQEFADQKMKLWAQVEELGGVYLDCMRVLRDPLEQFIDLDGREKVIRDYVKDPLKALVHDSSLVIADVMKDLRKVSSEDVKLQSAILTKKWLKDQQRLLKEKQAEIQAVDDRMKKDAISMMVREQEGYEQSVFEALEEIEKSKQVLIDELERTSVQLAWQKLRDSLRVLDKRVVLGVIE